MSSTLAQSIADLSSAEESKKLAAAGEVYRLGRATAGSAVADWWTDSELSALLLGPNPVITVGLVLLSKGHKNILFNLVDVNYIDSSGLGNLVGAFTSVRG